MDPAPIPSDPTPDAGAAELDIQDLREAAIRAERRSGRREATFEQARRHIILRMAIATAGAVIALAGLAMLVLPGPGIAIVILGLGIMATEVPWAARVLDEVKRRAKVDKLQQQPVWVKVVAVGGGVSAGIASVIVTLG